MLEALLLPGAFTSSLEDELLSAAVAVASAGAAAEPAAASAASAAVSISVLAEAEGCAARRVQAGTASAGGASGGVVTATADAATSRPGAPAGSEARSRNGTARGRAVT